jgi:hypothetical protein
MIPESVFPKLFPKKTLTKNHKRGARTKTKAILVLISIYHFKFFKLYIVKSYDYLEFWLPKVTFKD